MFTFLDSLGCFPYNLLHDIYFFFLKTIVVWFTDVLTLSPVPPTIMKIAQSYLGVQFFLKPLFHTYVCTKPKLEQDTLYTYSFVLPREEKNPANLYIQNGLAK